MEIDPYLQLAMLLNAFLGGICLGGVWQLLVASRILFGAYCAPEWMRARYAHVLPLLGRPVPFERKGISRRLWRSVVIGVGDALFCLLFAVMIVLLLYRYNDGAFRFSVPVVALCGFGLFFVLFARWLSLAVAYLAYGISAAWMYLTALAFLPPKGMRYLLLRFVCLPVCRLYRRVELRRARKYSAQLCQMQQSWAQRGFMGEKPSLRDQDKRKGRMRHEKKKRGQDNTHAVDDPHPHFDHIHSGACHRRQSTDGMERSSPSGGRA